MDTQAVQQLNPGEIYALVAGCIILIGLSILAFCSISVRSCDVPFLGEDDNV